ncbi:MAG: response regulator transcription factor [Oscillospiraceae bacterium]|nr:response regulator transcription factor [Oscillospiraceae bacterium]
MEQRLIYVADDEPNIRKIIQEFLEFEGYKTEGFESGDLLLEKFKDAPADLIILDVMMPGANGFVVCKELRKVSKVPIIVVSARDADLDYATALELGSDDYFTKPFSGLELTMRVKSIFRRIDFSRSES